MHCDEHGTLDYCPECLESNPTQAAIASAERAVIEVVVDWRRLRDSDCDQDVFFDCCDRLGAAVDALLDNGRRGKTITGPNKRPLKSLADMLKGDDGQAWKEAEKFLARHRPQETTR